MANPRSTFGKRQREQDRKDKARQKEQRLAARRSETRISKGPEIAWDEATGAVTSDDTDEGVVSPPATDPPSD